MLRDGRSGKRCSLVPTDEKVTADATSQQLATGNWQLAIGPAKATAPILHKPKQQSQFQQKPPKAFTAKGAKSAKEAHALKSSS
jgi:hypothetical protein